MDMTLDTAPTMLATVWMGGGLHLQDFRVPREKGILVLYVRAPCGVVLVSTKKIAERGGVGRVGRRLCSTVVCVRLWDGPCLARAVAGLSWFVRFVCSAREAFAFLHSFKSRRSFPPLLLFRFTPVET